MTQTILQSPLCASAKIKPVLQERLKDRKNLVYFASGRNIRNGYTELPYDNVVLVDKCFREPITIRGKVICICLTALNATSLFKQTDVKFDAFINLNCGLYEGGARYPIGGNWSLSNILPIMKDTYLHIACPQYHGRRVWQKKLVNLPHQTTLLGEADADYIDPRIFSDYLRYGKEFCVWKVTKQSGAPASFKCGNRDITVQRKNIWDDYDVLDSLFVRCTPSESRNVKNVAPKAEILKHYTFEQILQYCNRNKVTKLGLCPWLEGRYSGFLEFLKANEEGYPYPHQINFYHLHQNDFQQLYARAEQQAGC